MLLIPQIGTGSTILTTAEKCQTRPLLIPQSSAQWLIITVLLYAQFKSSCEIKAWKNSGLDRIWTHDLCDNGAVLYQLAIKPTGSWSHCKFPNISIEGKECKYIYEIYRYIWTAEKDMKLLFYGTP